MSKELEIVLRRLEREKAARKQAEAILEAKAHELYLANQSLESQVKARTADLAASEKQYKNIVTSATDIIFNLNEQGEFLFVNPAGLKISGYTEEEIIGTNFFRLVHEDYREEVLKYASKVIFQKQKEGYYEFPIVSKTGETFWIGQNIKRTSSDELDAQYTVLARDITERRKLQNDLERAKAIAEKAQKAESAFLANMSHEIRTPLNAIIGMSHLLKDAQLNKSENEYLDILGNSASVLHQLISDILDISKIDAGMIELNIKPFDLNQLLTNLEKTFRVRLDKKGIDFKINFTHGLKTVLLGDLLILNQIFLNLLSNAEKFTEAGEVSIDISMLKETEHYVKYKFEIKDTGIGMTQAAAKQIFHQFKQAHSEIKQNFGGTGLGLAITSKLIQELGSEIKVITALGKGSNFFFDLKFEKTNEQVIENQKSPELLDFKYLTSPILIVDDNDMNKKYITRLLEKWSIPYQVASNGQEAVDLAKINLFSMIFMDLQMPIMDGITATGIIRKTNDINSNTPIIALTASTLLSKKQESLKAGMDDFLAKPFNPQQLSTLIHKIGKGDQSILETESNAGYFSFLSELDTEYLNQNYGDDLEYGLDMMETFLTITPDELKNIDQAIANNDLDHFKTIVHKIKPTFPMVGLIKTFNDLEEIEKLAGTGNPVGFEKYNALSTQIQAQIQLIQKQTSLLSNHLSATKQ